MEYYPYKYFSGANVTVDIGNEKAFQCAGISFMVNESNQPVYGYASTLYDAVIPGRRIIQGSFVVNFVGRDIKVLNDMRNSGESFYHNQPLFDIKINYGIGSQSKTNYLLSGCFFISQGQTIQISENVILEEFSFIARDVKTFRETPAQIIEDTELPESKSVNAKSVDFSSNKYLYELFDPENNKEILSVDLTQQDMDVILAASPINKTNYNDKPNLINEQLKLLYTIMYDEAAPDENGDQLQYFESIANIKIGIQKNQNLNQNYPDNFLTIVFIFAKYINDLNDFGYGIALAHSEEEPLKFLNKIYAKATLTWINDKTGSN